MRPLKLAMEAFGTYIEKTEIDFTKFGEKGLFLVTGDTGSGKTTIFDGIMYALYGETSAGGGKNNTGRNGEMLRSDFAEPKQTTYAELEFENAGHVYKIWRSPSYEREGYKSAKPAEVRWSEDGRDTELKAADIDGKRTAGVAGRVREVLGLSADQFRQVAMIAQGDFRKLLVADTKARGDIFKTIFDTQIYDFIQMRVGQDCREAEQRFKEQVARLDGVIESICLPETDVLSACGIGELPEKLANGYPALSDILRMGKILLEQDETLLLQTKTQVVSYEKAIAEVQTMLSAFEKNKKEIDRAFGQYINHVDELLERQNTFKATEEEYRAWEQMSTDRLIIRQTELKKQMDACERLANEKAEEEKEKKRFERTKMQRDELLAKLTDLREQEKRWNLKFVKEDDTKALIERQQTERTRICERISDITMLRKNVEEIKKLEDERQQRETTTRLAFLKRKEANEAYEKAFEIRNGQICGELADALAEGAPCPVCGSLVHPNKAQKKGAGVTEQEVKAFRTTFDRADEDFREAEKQLEGFKSMLSEKERLAERTAEELLFGCGKPVKAFFSDADPEMEKNPERESGSAELLKAMDAALAALATQKKQAEHEISQLEKRHRQNLEAKTEWMRTREKIEQMEKKKEEADANCTAADRAYMVRRTAVAQLKQEAAGDAEKLRAELAGIKKELDEICKKKRVALSTYQQAKQEIDRLESLVKQDEIEQTHRYTEWTQLEAGFRQMEQPAESVETTGGQIKPEDVENASSLQKRRKRYIAMHAWVARKYEQLSEQMTGRFTQLNKKKTAASAEGDVIANRLIQNKAAYNRMDTLSGAFASAYQTYNSLSDLSQAMLGSYKLETYIQEVYFDQIITRANRRLRKMIYNQFELRRGMKTAGNRGLDLFVYDFRTGKERDVKTLSGGEAFVASLSMALGLADIVSEYAAGVRIDTLFIDEGFGALDSDILDQAVGVLAELSESDHLVGIISHVEELKRRIDRQIVVTKDKRGGSHIHMSIGW